MIVPLAESRTTFQLEAQPCWLPAIVEGVFDAAKVWQAGHRNVMALMGSRLWNAQALLHQHFRSAFLILDGEAGGQAAMEAMTAAVGDGNDSRCGSISSPVSSRTN